MNHHPFDDFLTQEWHTQRNDQRIVKFGLCFVVLIIVTTISAFAVSLNSWRTVVKDSSIVEVKWNEAERRVNGYIKTQRELQDSIESAKQFELLLDGVPRSLLLWEITQVLPQTSIIDDFRLNTRRRVHENNELDIKEFITLIGSASSDAEISKYIENLSISPFFANVSLQYAQEDQSGARRKFSIHMEVKRAAMLALEESS